MNSTFGKSRTARLAPDLESTLNCNDERILFLEDGRRLAYAEYGDPQGRPVVVFHGLPGSRCQRHPNEAVALGAGARVIHFDRPGFGRSDPKPGRTLADWPSDVAAAADLLGLDRFAVAGASGGGPYAIACAAKLSRRLTRVAVVSGVGPPGSMHRTAMLPGAWLALGLAPLAPWALRAALLPVARLATKDPDRYLDLVARHLAAVDQQVLARPDARAMFVEDLREAFRQGTRALVEDLALEARPWRLSLETVETEIAFWHGDSDKMIPASASQFLARELTATFHLCAREGHFMIFDRWPEIVHWLAV